MNIKNANINITSDTIFIFDLHGVLFKLSTFQIITEIYRTKYKLLLLKTLIYPKVIINTYISLKKGAIAEEVLLNLKTQFPNFEKLLPLGFNIINAQKPIPGTLNIIKNLKSKGHKLYIFSNIGEISIEILKNKYKDTFNMFDGILHSTKEDNFIKKPNPLAFDKCINFFNLDKSKIIFIDDKIINIKTAKDLGIQGILFKNPNDLSSIILKY